MIASETPKAIAIIQARCSSTRLPGKVLKPLAGKPMIWHIVQRAQSCKHVDQVIVATSTEPSDDPLATFCDQTSIPHFRGSLKNVLSRYLEILKKEPHDYTVRITGDCPLIHPPFIDRQIELLYKYDADVIRCNQSTSVLEGQSAHSRRSLEWIGEKSSHPDDLEHVGNRMYCSMQEAFRWVSLDIPKYLAGRTERIVVDEEADYQLMNEIYTRLYKGSPLSLEKAIGLIKKNRALAILNSTVSTSKINQELAAMRRSGNPNIVGKASWSP